MNLLQAVKLHQRRTFLTHACRGVGALGLSSLLAPPALAQQPKGVIAQPHVPPKAKRVIFMVMAGGPVHLETFDHKPELAKRNGQPMPEIVTKGQPIAQLQGAKLTCFGPQCGFKKHGKSGQEMNELFPHLPEVADDLCIVRSLQDGGDQPRPGPHVHEHRHAASRAGRAWGRGSPTASAASRTTCPASSS